jgi:ABC-type multidrug transport system fused ATPase/permease subunit
LILDEATSQLDIDTEAKILNALLKDKPDLTVVMATHRIGSVAAFTRRLRIEDGRIFEL